MHFETKAIHAGAHVDEETGAIAPPIHLSTTFERTEEGEPSRGFSYVRDGNPTQARLEEALAAIDCAGGRAGVRLGHGRRRGAAADAAARRARAAAGRLLLRLPRAGRGATSSAGD